MAISTLTKEQYPPGCLNRQGLGHWQRPVCPTTSHRCLTRIGPKGILAVNVPVTLFPSPFPRSCFEQARSVQKTYNELYAAISRDEDFLSAMVNEVKGGDDFISKLWDTHVRVKKEGYTQKLSLGLFRSDYLVHQDTSSGEPKRQVKQVEFNTIASSFGGLSSRTSLLHKQTDKTFTANESRFLSVAEYPLLGRPIESGSLNLPENKSVQGLSGGIRAAFDAYGPSELGHKKCVIFVLPDDPVPVFRIPYSELLRHTEVAATPKRQLLYKLPRDPSKVFEVAVAYLRCWYDPSDYPDESAWEARYHLERSAAVKCPTVLTQLAGSKKIQQVLATPRSGSSPSVLGRFIPDDAPQTAEVFQTFTNIFPMDTSEAGAEGRPGPELCKNYVLKPQREGGGNNHYREDIPEFLKKTPRRIGVHTS
ncbi:LOW QUALITY PROTEIN: glutathione synthetase [Colletotrichum tofieldiae]|nr:LOW QUALITY PROTEIN: glutathione synthetase [Colletotrichum tofieldiae]